MYISKNLCSETTTRARTVLATKFHFFASVSPSQGLCFCSQSRALLLATLADTALVPRAPTGLGRSPAGGGGRRTGPRQGLVWPVWFSNRSG